MALEPPPGHPPALRNSRHSGLVVAPLLLGGALRRRRFRRLRRLALRPSPPPPCRPARAGSSGRGRRRLRSRLFVSIVIANSADPAITRSVGITLTVELTNCVVSLRPEPSRICRREPGSCGRAVWPTATPSGWRISRTYSASWRIAVTSFSTSKISLDPLGREPERLGRLLVLHEPVGVGDHQLVRPRRQVLGQLQLHRQRRLGRAERLVRHEPLDRLAGLVLQPRHVHVQDLPLPAPRAARGRAGHLLQRHRARTGSRRPTRSPGRSPGTDRPALVFTARSATRTVLPVGELQVHRVIDRVVLRQLAGASRRRPRTPPPVISGVNFGCRAARKW